MTSHKVINLDSESITGTLLGSAAGVVAHYSFQELLITGVLAVATGFLGALGAHAFKIIRNKLKLW